MMVKKKITKCIVGIVCLLSIAVLGSKTEIVLANDEKNVNSFEETSSKAVFTSRNTIKKIADRYGLENPNDIEKIIYVPIKGNTFGEENSEDVQPYEIGFGEYYIKAKDEKKELQEPVYSSWYEVPKGGMQFRKKISIEYQTNEDYNIKNLRILKKVVEKKIHFKNKVFISASQYVNVKNGYKKNIKACIFYQSYSIQLYEKDLFFDDKITTGKVKIPIGIVFIVSRDIKNGREA